MSNITILRSKIIEQIENVIYEEEKADDIKISIKKEKVKVTLNNNKPFYISYKNYSKNKILNDNGCWLKLVKKSIKKELKKSSHKELYAVHLVDGFDLGDLNDILYVQIKSIYSELGVFFCYATENDIDKFMNSNQGKLKYELNDIIEIPDQDIDENDGDRSISRSRSTSLVPYPHIKRIGALNKTENIDYPSNLFVFILDTGAYKKHKDLNINTQYSKNFTNSTLDDWDDANGHGTHVAGTIGAKDSTFAVAPGVQIIIHKVLGDNGRGNTQWIADSLDDILEFKKNNPSAKIVVNMSLTSKVSRIDAGPYKNGKSDPTTNELKLYEKTIQNLIIKKGITFIVAAGNDTTDTSVSIPARIPETITVGAYSFNKIATFSNFGYLIDIMAPGVKIYSTWTGYVKVNNEYVDTTNTTVYNTYSGTSMAAPIVTGAVVNMIAVEAIKNPNKILTPQEIKYRLQSDAENTANIKNAENTASINEKITMVNNYKYKCWEYPSEFTEKDCLTWWFTPITPTVDSSGNIIAASSLDQTYPYGVYIGRYTKDGKLIENY